MERDVALVTEWWSWEVIASLLLIIGLVIAGWWQLIKQRSPWVLVGLVWLGGTLIPVSGIVPINGILYEHWLYLPIIGLMLIGYGLFGQLAKKYLKRQWLLWVLGIVVTIYVGLTIRQNYIWGDPIRFYEYTLTYSQSARLHNNLAMSYSEVKRIDEAIVQYQKSLELSNVYPQPYHNLGNAYFEKGEFKKAEESYKQALQLDPTFFFTYPKIINLYITTGELAKSIPYLDKMVQIDPQNVEIWMIYGKVLADLDQPELSKQKFDQVRKLSGGGVQIEAQIQRLLAIPKPASDPEFLEATH
jgi:tetratricopeptide (TPR) repeat protein